MAKVYKNTIGFVLALDVGESLDTASDYWICALKPSGVEVKLPLTGNADREGDTKIFYTFQVGELSEVGRWQLQSYVRFLSWEGRGETASLKVCDFFE